MGIPEIRGLSTPPLTLNPQAAPAAHQRADEVPPVDSASVSGGPAPQPVSGDPAVPGFTVSAATAASLAGTVAASLADPDLLAAMNAAQSRGVEFTRRRSFRIPVLMDKHEKVDAAGVLQSFNDGEQDRLGVRSPGTDVLPLREKQDLIELQAFFAGGDIRTVSDPSLGSLVRDLQLDGYELRDGAGKKSDVIGPYGAYNALTSWKGQEDASQAAWVWRNGTPLGPLPEDAGQRPVEVREEIRRGKLALEELEKKVAGDDDARQDLDALRNAVGNASFATRAGVRAKLQEKRPYGSNHRLDYGLIAKSVRPGEKLEDVAAFFLRVLDKNEYGDVRDTHGAFNYVRNHFSNEPVLAESFLNLFGMVRNINVTVRAVDVLRKPVAGETYQEREAVFVQMVSDEDAILASYSNTSGQQALDDFQYVAADLKPGETFASVAGDFLAVLKGLRQVQVGLGQARPTFRHIRDRLGADPQRRAWFAGAFGELGTLDASKRAMELIYQPLGATDAAARATVALGLLANTHDVHETSRYMQTVAGALQPGQDFARAGQLMSGLMSDVAEWSYHRDQDGLSKAFTYTHGTLNSDPTEVEQFRKIVRWRKSFDTALDIFPTLRTAVRGETQDQRVDLFLKIADLAEDGRHASKLYGTVTGNLLPGETLQDGVHQLEALTTAIRQDGRRDDPAQAFVDLKKRHSGNPDKIRLFTRLCEGLQSYNNADKVRMSLDKAVGSETAADREATFFRLLDLEKQMESDGRSAVLDYKALVKGLVPGESLQDGVTRLVALRTAIRRKDGAQDACDCYAFIADSLKEGTISGRTATEITAEMVESLLLNGDINAAKNRATAPRNKDGGGIEKEDGFVIIGGIKVPVK